MNKKTLDMTSGNIKKLLIVFAIPLIIENVFELLYNTVDTMIVGKFIGKLALAAVGTTSQILNFFLGIFMGLSAGGTVIAARHFGAKDEVNMRKDIGNMFAVAIVSGILLMLFGLVMINPALRATNTPSDVFPFSAIYLRIYFYAIPAMAIFSVGSGLLRAFGNSKAPVYVLVISCLINIGLDLLFVIKFNWGIAGAAAATSVSIYFSMMSILLIFATTKEIYNFKLFDIKLNRKTLASIYHYSTPLVLERGITHFSNIFVQGYLNVFGAAYISGCTIYNRIDGFVFMAIQNMGTAILTFTGQNVGARKYKRVKQGLKEGLEISLILTIVSSATIMLLREPIAYLFTDDIEIVNFACKLFLTFMPLYVIICLYNTYGSVLKGVGSVVPTTIASLNGFVLAKQLYLYFGTRFIMNTPMFAMASYPFGWAVCAVGMLGYFYSYKWKAQLGLDVHDELIDYE